VFRIGAGVAVGIGLLVAGGVGRDAPPSRAPAVDGADDVEAPVPTPPPAVAPGLRSAPPAPPAPALPPARAGWQAGAHPPQDVVPSVLVKAARHNAGSRACVPPAGTGADHHERGRTTEVCDPARAVESKDAPERPAVEIEWNAPGSTP
jgi:hypothetical protein